VSLAPPRIVCAACKLDETIILGARHFDHLMHKTLNTLEEYGVIGFGVPSTKFEQGFIDQFGEFHDRIDALAIADAAGQLNVVRPKTRPENELFSEDLY